VGLAGLAALQLSISPALQGADASSPAAVLALARAQLSALSAQGLVTSNPQLSIATLSDVAQLLAVAGAAGDAATVALARSVKESLASTLWAALNASASALTGSALIDDGLLQNAVRALSNVSSVANEVTPGASSSILGALRTGLALAVPAQAQANATVALGSSTAAVAPLPALLGAMAARALANVLSASAMWQQRTGAARRAAAAAAAALSPVPASSGVFSAFAPLMSESASASASNLVLSGVSDSVAILTAALLRGAAPGALACASSVSAAYTGNSSSAGSSCSLCRQLQQ